VIDPGVGTSRRRIAIKGKPYLYVGPDNGLLPSAAKAERIEKIVEISNYRFIITSTSTIFEGRKIFAFVEANFLKGLPIEDLCPEIHVLVEPLLIEPEVNGDRIIGFVVHNDWFGNLITNLSKGLLDKLRIIECVLFDVNLGGVLKIIRFCRAYGEVPDNYPIVIIGSSGFLEVSINLGSI
jgi:S-adenosylmethionine hydrolase